MYQFKHIDCKGTEMSIQIPYADVTSDELCEIFVQFLLACGFHPEAVKRSMNKEVE